MSDKINTGGPAFPVPGLSNLPNDQCLWPEIGMTLRDYFAAKAMQGIVSTVIFEKRSSEVSPDSVADAAFNIADAMLKAREVSQ